MNKLTFNGFMNVSCRTTLLVLFGVMIATTSIIAKQDGLPNWVSMSMIFIGLFVCVIGLWNTLMSFTVEQDKYFKLYRS